MSTWRDNLVEKDQEAQELLLECHRLAILGIKTEEQSGQPAYYVAEYLQGAGYDVVPVPVYYPDCKIILGQPVCRQLQEVGHVDAVIVFRRPQDIPAHVDDIIAVKPRLVWFQLGIRNEEAAARLAQAGIKVVQDKCSLVEHRRAVARAAHS